MLESKLVLVLGAGSSLEFGASDTKKFPLGDGLRDEIAHCLRIEVDHFGREVQGGDREIFSAYRFVSEAASSTNLKVGMLLSAGREIASALPGCESIDDFLERHSGDEALEKSAKLAIARCILRAEQSSPLTQDVSRIEIPSIDRYRSHWLTRFLHTISKRANKTTIGDALSNLKVVNYNYDRCFERFTYLWLRHVYRLRDAEADDVMAKIQIIHPYGSLGHLPTARGQGVPFGYDASPRELFEISKNISTYSESIEQDKRPEKIRGMASGCQRFIFVGYGFHQQNMDLLDLPEPLGSIDVFATTVRLPEPRWLNAQSRIRTSLCRGRRVIEFHSSAVSAEDLVDHYGDRWME